MSRKPPRTPATLFGEPDATMDARARKTQPRPRDEVWEAVVELFYASGVPSHPKSLRARVNAEVQGFRDLQATPDDIKRRVLEYPRVFPGVACTALAVLRHWDRLAGPKRSQTTCERVGHEFTSWASNCIKCGKIAKPPGWTERHATDPQISAAMRLYAPREDRP